MAKNFGKANSINKIKEVAKANNEKANVIEKWNDLLVG